MMVEIILAIFASTGFWAFITTIIQKHDSSKSSRNKIIKGLAYERICALAREYIADGFISKEDYECLKDYLYTPYKELGGDGTADRLMKEVEQLTLKHD